MAGEINPAGGPDAAAAQAPKKTESGAQTPELSPTAEKREKAAKVIKPMLVAKARALAESRPEDALLTDGEKALAFYADVLTMPPFKPLDDGPVPLDEGSPLMLPLSKEGTTFNARITAISRLDADPVNGRVYYCIVEGPDGAREIPVPEDALADAQLATADGEKILELFNGDATRDEKTGLETYRGLLEQRRNPGDPDPEGVPDDLLTTLGERYPLDLIQPEGPEPTQPETLTDETRGEKYKEVNAELTKQIDALEKSILEMKDANERQKALDRLLLMKIAVSFNGPLGIFYKVDALEAVRDAIADPLQKGALQQRIDSLNPLVEAADESFQQFLSEQNISPDTLQEWVDVAQDPDKGMRALLDRDDVRGLPDMQAQLCGPDFDQAKFEEMIDSSHLTSEQKSLLKKVGKGSLWAIIIALGGSLAAVLGAGVGGAFTIKGISTAGQQ
jgi:hypothetical protein